jgi:chromosome segregation ATPase
MNYADLLRDVKYDLNNVSLQTAQSVQAITLDVRELQQCFAGIQQDPCIPSLLEDVRTLKQNVSALQQENQELSKLVTNASQDHKDATEIVDGLKKDVQDSRLEAAASVELVAKDIQDILQSIANVRQDAETMASEIKCDQQDIKGVLGAIVDIKESSARTEESLTQQINIQLKSMSDDASAALVARTDAIVDDVEKMVQQKLMSDEDLRAKVSLVENNVNGMMPCVQKLNNEVASTLERLLEVDCTVDAVKKAETLLADLQGQVDTNKKKAFGDVELVAKDIQDIIKSMAHLKEFAETQLKENSARCADMDVIMRDMQDLRQSTAAMKMNFQSGESSLDAIVREMQDLRKCSAAIEGIFREVQDLRKSHAVMQQEIQNAQAAFIGQAKQQTMEVLFSLRKEVEDNHAKASASTEILTQDFQGILRAIAELKQERLVPAMMSAPSRIRADAFIPTRRVEWLIRGASKTLIPYGLTVAGMGGAPRTHSWMSPKFDVGNAQDLQLELQLICNEQAWESCGVALSLWGTGGLHIVFKLYAGHSSSELRHTFDSNSPAATMKFSSLSELCSSSEDDTLRTGVEIIEAVHIHEHFDRVVATPRPSDGERPQDLMGSILEHCYFNQGSKESYRTMAMITKA